MRKNMENLRQMRKWALWIWLQNINKWLIPLTLDLKQPFFLFQTGHCDCAGREQVWLGEPKSGWIRRGQRVRGRERALVHGDVRQERQQRQWNFFGNRKEVAKVSHVHPTRQVLGLKNILLHRRPKGGVMVFFTPGFQKVCFKFLLIGLGVISFVL